jgi:radical SAM-linked protein
MTSSSSIPPSRSESGYVTGRIPPLGIPVEVQLKKQLLQAAHAVMEAANTSLEPSPMLDLRAVIEHSIPLDAAAWTQALIASDLVEDAGEVLRSARHVLAERSDLRVLESGLKPLVEKARKRRAALWHLDTRRQLIRFSYVKENGALPFDDGDLHALFLHAFRLEGIGLALDMGKRPRPLFSVGLPLPAQVGGRAECMDAVLKREPMEAAPLLLARLNRRLPLGLHVHTWTALPAYATPLADLALRAWWRWELPVGLQDRVAAGLNGFLAADTWRWDRGGAKGEASLDLRTIVQEPRLEDAVLTFSTRLGDFHALNPLKVLGALFGLEETEVRGLVRTDVDVKIDPRLGQAERFEPKLKNMFEDAVLLGGGSNITLVDEDDDEPLRLG